MFLLFEVDWLTNLLVIKAFSLKQILQAIQINLNLIISVNDFLSIILTNVRMPGIR